MWIGSPDGSRSRRRAAERPWRRRPAAAGFTLLEVLVAFTILALMLTVLLRIFSEGFRGIGSADLHAVAALHAQSALASVGAEIPITVGEWAGEHDDGFRWQVSIGLHDDPTMLATLKSFIVYRVVASARRGAVEVTLWGLRIGAVQPTLPEGGEDAAGGAQTN